MHQLKRVSTLPISLDEAWDFFSSPKNLKILTPDYMGFDIINQVDLNKMYEGQIICYKVKPLLGIPLSWMTEITHIRDKEFFVDEQRIGPYKVWHHQHHFKKVAGGVEMTDIVDYVLPLGFIGRLANSILVKKQLKEIFDYREIKTKELFR